MNEHLTNWLNGSRNYIVGMVLYKQFGSDDAIKRLLAAGKTDYSEKLLLSSINALIDTGQQLAPEKLISSYDLMPESPDAVLQSLKNRWMPMYTEMNYKRHALDKLLDEPFEKAGAQRATLAKDILDLEKKCIDVWQQRDHYVKHNCLPGKSIDEEIIIDRFEAAKRIANLKIYVRRYKNQLLKDPGSAEAAQLLTRYTDELTKLQLTHG